jgi:hypothetical protein
MKQRVAFRIRSCDAAVSGCRNSKVTIEDWQLAILAVEVLRVYLFCVFVIVSWRRPFDRDRHSSGCVDGRLACKKHHYQHL